MFSKASTPKALIVKVDKTKKIISELISEFERLEQKEKTANELIIDLNLQIRTELLDGQHSVFGPRLRAHWNEKELSQTALNEKNLKQKGEELRSIQVTLGLFERHRLKQAAMRELVEILKETSEKIFRIDQKTLQEKIHKIKRLMTETGIVPGNWEIFLTPEEETQIRAIIRMDPKNFEEEKQFINLAYPSILKIYLGIYAKLN